MLAGPTGRAAGRGGGHELGHLRLGRRPVLGDRRHDGAADTIGPLGSVPQVRQRVEAVWPETTWDADGTAWVERDDVIAEVELGTGDPVGSLMVQVRGGRDPVQAVLDLCRRHRLDPDGLLDRTGADGAGERLRAVAALQEAAGQPPEP